ncbi:MAG: beta strand repeat-containing protein [Oceanococcus sp.]
MIKHTIGRHLLLTLMLALLAACSSDNESSIQNGGIPDGAPTSMQFQQNALQAVAAVGTSTQLNLIANFDDGLSKAVSSFDVTELADWVSSDPTIANVSNVAGTKGLVFGGEAGTTIIRATFRGIITEISFTVTNAQLQQLDISPAAPRLLRGTTIDVTVNGRYSDGSTLDLTDDVTLSSADASIATISNPANSPARLVGVAAGTTSISASFGNISDQATVTVLAGELQSLSLSPNTPSVAKGSTLNFTLTAQFSDGLTQDVTESAAWTSSNPNFVAVDNTAGSKGDAVGVDIGTAVITASFQDQSANTQVTVTTAVLSSIEIDPPSASIAKGTSQTFTATGIYSDNTTQDISTAVNWTSSNSAVGSISNLSGTEGEVQGLDVGDSTIGASFQGETASADLTVTAAAVTSLAIEPADATVALNRTKQFVAIATLSDASTQDVTNDALWSSDDDTIVTISNDTNTEGLASPVAEGTATVSVSFSDITESTSLTVGPNAVITSIAVTADNTSVANGTTEQLTATAVYDDGSADDVTAEAVWSSANEAIATVSNETDEEGVVTGQGIGTANITASFGGVDGVLEMTVTAAILEGITVEPANPSIPIQTQQPFTAIGSFSDGTSQDITTQVIWSSSNAAIASVNNAAGSKGIATGNSIGTASITATKDSFSASSVLTVTDAVLQTIQISPPSAHIADGITVKYSATGVYSDGSKRTLTNTVTWSSTNTAVAAISNAGATKGRAAGDAAGTTSIQAVLGGVFASSNLQVTDATLTLEVTPANQDLPVGVKQQYVATGTFDNGVPTRDLSDQVTWVSSTPAFASINPQGLATAVSAGTTTITATHSHAINNATTTGMTDATVIDAQVTELVVTPKAQSIADGTMLQFTATATFTDGQVRDVTDDVDWVSSVPSVATVTDTAPKGMATAVDPGQTTITATVPGGGPSNATNLAVTDAELVSISVSPGSASIAEGRTQTFTAEGTYTDDSTQDVSTSVTWTSSAPTIASIDNSAGNEGIATALSTGTSQIAAGLNGVDSSNATVEVTDAVITQIDVTPIDPDQPKGTSRQFTATATFSDGTSNIEVTNEVTWSTSASAIADVSNAAGTRGVVFGNDLGSADITAEDTSSGETGSSTVTVTDAILVAIQLIPVSAEMPQGYTLQYTAMGQFSDASTDDITASADTTWTSLDSSVASVDANGIASGVAAGQTSISVSQVNAEGSVIKTSTSLTVSDVTLQSLVVSLANASDDQELGSNESVQMKALGNFSANVSNFDVTSDVNWNSSNTLSISIDGDGLASSTLVPGQSNITAAQDGVSSNAITLTNTGF